MSPVAAAAAPAAPWLAARILPPLSGLAAATLDVLPWQGAGSTAVAPVLTVCAVHFWTLHAPDRLPPLAVFAIGVALDALGGTPLGLGPATLLVARAAALGGRRFLPALPLAAAWLAFAPTALAFALLRWAVAALWWGRLFPLGPSVAEAALTFAVYPLVGWPLARLCFLLAPARARAAGR